MAGLVASSNIRTSDANNIGLNLELDAILAVVIGGTALGAGGRFSLFASIIGALVIQAITTSMYAIGVPANALLAIKGIVVIIVILLLSDQVRGCHPPARPRARPGRHDRPRRPACWVRYQRFAPMGATILLFCLAYAYGAIAYEGMRDPQVFLNLFRAAPFLLISAIGMTFVILSGGIDLSVGGVVALTTVASAALLRGGGMDPWLVIVLMLLMGMAFGATMGIFITYLKVQPFIATLAGLWVARGLCFWISDDAIAIDNRLYDVLGADEAPHPRPGGPGDQAGRVRLDPRRRRVRRPGHRASSSPTTPGFGRTVYAIGGNEASARLMGLRGEPHEDPRLHAQRVLLGPRRHRAEHLRLLGPRPVRDGPGADGHRCRGHRRDAADAAGRATSSARSSASSSSASSRRSSSSTARSARGGRRSSSAG